MNDIEILDKSKFLLQYPKDLNTEKLLLGQLIYAGSNGNDHLDKVINIIENITKANILNEHFFNPLHAKIYTLIFNNYTIQRPVLIPILTSDLYKDDYFKGDKQVTELYLENLLQNACMIGQVEELTNYIIDLSTKRQLISINHNFLSALLNEQQNLSAKEIIAKFEKDLSSLSIYGNYNRDSRSIGTICDTLLQKINYNREHKIDLTGLKTGYRQMDHLLGGFQNSDLIIIAARPAMGKTSFALCLALNIAENIRDMKEKLQETNQFTNDIGAVGFISLEMSGEQLVTRLISMKSGISSMNLKSCKTLADDYEKIVMAVNNIKGLDFEIDDSASISMTLLKSKVRRMAMKNNIKILFVDYLQLLHGSKPSSYSNRVNEVSEISRGLKELAKELNIPVVAMAQLSREVEKRDDKIPKLSDLRESGSIEQDADIVMFIHREEYYMRHNEPKPKQLTNENSNNDNGNDFQKEVEVWQDKMNEVLNEADIIIAKHRNGAVGFAKLKFDHNTTAFSDPEEYQSN